MRQPRRPQTSCQHWRAFMVLAIMEFGGLVVVGSTEQIVPPRVRVVEERLQVANEALAKALLSPLICPACAAALPTAIKYVNEAQSLISSNEAQPARGKIVSARESNADCLNHVAPIEDSSNRQDLYSMTIQADKALQEVEMLLSVITTLTGASLPAQDLDLKPVKTASRDLMVLGSMSTNSSQVQHQHTADNSLRSRVIAELPVIIPEGKRSPNTRKKRPGPQKLATTQQCPSYQVDGTVCQYSACAQGRNLVSCSIGFAKGVLGGYNGQSYTVTSDQDHPDNPPFGTLRYGLNLAKSVPGGVWITFSRDLTIELRAMLWVHSHTTVDGRGFNIIIHRHMVVMSGAKQVILENIQVNSVRGGDTVHIYSGCWKIWVDHVTSFGGDLGLISVLQGSTDVTISNSKLSNYNFNMLLGASDNDVQDKNMRVSVYRNHFHDSTQRMPHCRWGWCHVANNLYTNWGYYAIGARVNARVKTENNVFVPGRKTEVTPWHPGATPGSDDFSARIESTGDILLNGATFHQYLSASHDVRPPYPNGDYPPIIPADRVRNLVSSCAGAQPPRILYSCQRAAGV